MSILMSIKPKWCELIASGKKTIEVRKTRPKIDTPFKVYIYCTNNSPYLVYAYRFDGQSFWEGYCTVKGYSRERADKLFGGVLNGKVIGEFVCDEIIDIYPGYIGNQGDDCLTYNEREEYLGTGENGKSNHGYGWHISDLKIYDNPKELSAFSKVGFVNYVPLKRPPQSWMNVGEIRIFDLEKPFDITASDKIKFVKFPPIPPLPPLI